jgi:hypothetical protein
MKKPIALAVLLGAAALVAAGCRSKTPAELKASIEVLDVQTKWASKYYQAWPPRLVIVPVISFRVKNVGDKPLAYVNFNAVFNFKGEAENFGDNFLAAIRSKGVPPGETSQEIVLKSNFGVDGKDLKGIQNNPGWKAAEARSRCSSASTTSPGSSISRSPKRPRSRRTAGGHKPDRGTGDHARRDAQTHGTEGRTHEHDSP